MIAQEIPGPQHVYEDDHGLIDFVLDGNYVKEEENEFSDENNEKRQKITTKIMIKQ